MEKTAHIIGHIFDIAFLASSAIQCEIVMNNRLTIFGHMTIYLQHLHTICQPSEEEIEEQDIFSRNLLVKSKKWVLDGFARS